jgi:hypothetical protein
LYHQACFLKAMLKPTGAFSTSSFFSYSFKRIQGRTAISVIGYIRWIF